MRVEELNELVLPWPNEGKDWDGLPMAYVGLRAVFYFGDGYTESLRRVLLTIVEEYIAMAGGNIRSYQRAGDRRRLVADADHPVDLGRLQDRVKNFQTDWAIDLTAASDVNVASLWSLVTVASHTGYLLVHFPVTAFEKLPPNSFRLLFQRWCSALNVGHAYAGLGLALPVAGRTTYAAINHCGPYVERFPGLDVDYPSTVARRCNNGIRSVNWLTSIDATRLKRVGSADSILRIAGDVVTSMDYNQGTIFVAGNAPQIGDRDAGNFPSAYASLGHQLAPIRSDIPEPWFNPPAGYEVPPGFESKSGANDAEPEELPALHYTKAWLARFD
jgi:hypothetical protein